MFAHLNLGRRSEYTSPFKAVCISKPCYYDEDSLGADEPVPIPIEKPSRKVQYLPGERLLKSINCKRSASALGSTADTKDKIHSESKKSKAVLQARDIEKIRNSINKLTLL